MIPRRSVLYMPGSNQRALEKARELAADVLVFDLEDAVAPSAKETARAQVRAAVSAGDYGYRQIVIRINGLDTPWYQEDLASFANSEFCAILVPKVETGEQVADISRDMHRLAYYDACRLWVMAKTSRSILNIEGICEGSGRLEAVVMGTSDLAKDMPYHTLPSGPVFCTHSVAVSLLPGLQGWISLMAYIWICLIRKDSKQYVNRVGIWVLTEKL